MSSIAKGPGDMGPTLAADRIIADIDPGDVELRYPYIAGALQGVICIMDAKNLTPAEYVKRYIGESG